MTEFRFMMCPTCGIEYAAPRGYLESREIGGNNNGKSWYCPNGHALVFAETKFDALRRERDNLKQQIARAESEADEARQLQAKAESMLAKNIKRSGAGVCPCCHRTFQALARHMKTKHPNIVPIRQGEGLHERERDG